MRSTKIFQTSFAALLFLSWGCVAVQSPAELPESTLDRATEYERRFAAQVDEAYQLFRQGSAVPVCKIVGGDDLHLEFALAGRAFWQNLRTGFSEIGRNMRSDFTDKFITLPHQGGIRVGFVDLVRAKMIWQALRGDNQTDLVMTLDIPLVPDRVVQEDPALYRNIDLSPEIPHKMAVAFGIIPKGHVVDVQGAKFADDSLRFAKLDIRFPELKQEGRRNIRMRREGTFKQIKVTTWQEAPTIRRDMLSLPQLVLPKGVALVAMIPAERTECSQPSNSLSPITYAIERRPVQTSLILLILPKRAADAFAER